MPSASYQAILGMGGFFVLLGIILIIWNKREREGYYNSILLTRKDIKESLTHDPDRPWLHAWRVGGKISLIIGIMLLIIGGILWLVT